MVYTCPYCRSALLIERSWHDTYFQCPRQSCGFKLSIPTCTPDRILSDVYHLTGPEERTRGRF